MNGRGCGEGACWDGVGVGVGQGLGVGLELLIAGCGVWGKELWFLVEEFFWVWVSEGF